MIGHIVNYRYEVLEKVGDGELFSVYKTRDKVLNRLVALKVLNKDVAANEGFAAAVRESYQGVVGLDHPSIARVFECESTDGESYVACEYVRGTSVKERVRRAGPVSVALALDIIVPVLEALEYAHAMRVVHGNVRPQDIIVSPDGEVKLTDFGLSGALRACPVVADRYAMRSVHYAAPEIAEGAPASVASDLYSVGVVLYEMLTGVLPFAGATAVAVALKQAKELPIPPRSINTGVPKSLSDLVVRAIEKDPVERFRSASAMLADLRAMRDALRVGRPVSIPQPAVSAPLDHDMRGSAGESEEPSLKKSYLWLALVFVVVFLVSLGGAMFFFQGERGKVELPLLVDKKFDVAREDARQAGLRLRRGEEVYSDTIEEGNVAAVYLEEIDKKGIRVKTVLEPGDKVDRNAEITARMSKGRPPKPVPDVTGLMKDDAYRIAEDEDFKIGRITVEYSDEVAENSVIRQMPGSGAKRVPGSAINIVVSMGPKLPSGDEQPGDGTSLGAENKYNTDVEVGDAQGSQEVRIVVTDDRGETTVYQEYHEPNEHFVVPVTTYGTRPRIQVFVGDTKIKDDYY